MEILQRLADIFGPLGAILTFATGLTTALGYFVSRGAAAISAVLSVVAISVFVFITYGPGLSSDGGGQAVSDDAEVAQVVPTRFEGITKFHRDCPDCPELTYVRPAVGIEGAANTDHEGLPDERPQHVVRIPKGYWIGRDEVTVSEFSSFIAQSGYAMAPGCRVKSEGIWHNDPGAGWQAPGFPQDTTSPVVCVSYTDAAAYTRWLSGKTGRQYRLPTESEWEVAARAGSRDRYISGATLDASSANVISGGNSPAGTVAVGRYAPNALGMYDVAGNAWEWTRDCGTDDYTSAPRDGTADISGNCDRRVTRGGAFANPANQARFAKRSRDTADYRFFDVGFRVAADASETE